MAGTRLGRRAAGRRTTVLLTAALLGLPLTTLPATGETESPRAPVRPTLPADPPAGPAAGDEGRVQPGDEPLEQATRGRAAVRQLGDRLPEVARLNDLSPSRLGSLLEEDRTLWVDPTGHAFYREPEPTAAEVEAAAAARTTPEPSAPLEETFRLHSRPGADRTIFLDVDGATVSGTAWNTHDGVAASHPGWDPAGDGPAFSDTERAEVQAVWQMVAADFAAFDVDVTTEDPGAAGLSRASTADPTYGARVLITPSADAAGKICDHACGGVAYISVFGEVDAGSPYYQPAWVFTGPLSDSPKAVAEAASHEVGHQLGLNHDGKDGSDYYGGHGSWGPIMGATYSRPVSQWSRGSYPGATNTQNDLAVIAGRIPRVPDEAGAGVAGSAPLPEGSAYVTTRSDVDTYSLGPCEGGITASATTAALGPDLDLRLTLLDAEGGVVATDDPASATVDPSRASGMDASVTSVVSPGTYHLSVEGVGHGTPDGGYDDYASVGGYVLDVTGCNGAARVGAPSAPRELAATPDAREPEVTLTWAEPADGVAAGVTGYTLSRSGSATPVVLPAHARSHTLRGLEPGTDYTLTVRAQNASGTGPGAVVVARTAATPVRVPGAPRSFAARWDADAGQLAFSWEPPADDGGAAVSAYHFASNGRNAGSVDGAARTGVGSTFDPGTYRLEIRAENSAGRGPAAAAVVTVPPLATRARTGREALGRTVRLRTIVRLPDGATDGGGPPSGKVVFRDRGRWVGRASLRPLDGERSVARIVLRRVRPGWHRYRGQYVPDDAVRLARSGHGARPIRVRRR